MAGTQEADQTARLGDSRWSQGKQAGSRPRDRRGWDLRARGQGGRGEQGEKPGEKAVGRGVRPGSQKTGPRAGEQGGDLSDKDSSREGQFPTQTENLLHASSRDGTAPGRGSPEHAVGRGWGGKCLPCLSWGARLGMGEILIAVIRGGDHHCSAAAPFSNLFTGVRSVSISVYDIIFVPLTNASWVSFRWNRSGSNTMGYNLFREMGYWHSLMPG